MPTFINAAQDAASHTDTASPSTNLLCLRVFFTYSPHRERALVSILKGPFPTVFTVPQEEMEFKFLSKFSTWDNKADFEENIPTSTSWWNTLKWQRLHFKDV